MNTEKSSLLADWRRTRRFVDNLLQEKNVRLVQLPQASPTRRVGLWIVTMFVFCVARSGAWLALLVPLLLFTAIIVIAFPAIGITAAIVRLFLRLVMRFSTE